MHEQLKKHEKAIREAIKEANKRPDKPKAADPPKPV